VRSHVVAWIARADATWARAARDTRARSRAPLTAPAMADAGVPTEGHSLRGVGRGVGELRMWET